MNFKDFLLREDNIDAAILGVFSGSTPITSQAQRQHLLMRNTAEFSSDILRRVANLGVVKAIGEDDVERFNDVVQSVKRGISIKDLIAKIKGPVVAPNAVMQGSLQQDKSVL